MRSGEMIRYAKSVIERGSGIKETLVIMPVSPELDSLPIATPASNFVYGTLQLASGIHNELALFNPSPLT